MNILVLGGSQFVGKHIVIRLLAEGHSVTLFNRGKTAPFLFPEAEQIVGNRDGGLDSLPDKHWDVAIDVSAYIPRLCQDSTAFLLDKVDRYCLISTISVYDSPFPNTIESHKLLDSAHIRGEEINSDTYGPMKARCEQYVQQCFPMNHLIIRPSYVIGPDDPTDRFNAWLRRVNQGGVLLAPGTAEDAIQYIDVRDLARFVCHLISTDTMGTFNAAGPNNQTTWGELLTEMQSAMGISCDVQWCSEVDMARLNVPDNTFPLWAKQYLQSYFQVSNSHALANGLELRSLSDTVADAWQWEMAFGQPVNILAKELEVQLSSRASAYAQG